MGISILKSARWRFWKVRMFSSAFFFNRQTQYLIKDTSVPYKTSHHKKRTKNNSLVSWSLWPRKAEKGFYVHERAADTSLCQQTWVWDVSAWLTCFEKLQSLTAWAWVKVRHAQRNYPHLRRPSPPISFCAAWAERERWPQTCAALELQCLLSQVICERVRVLLYMKRVMCKDRPPVVGRSKQIGGGISPVNTNCCSLCFIYRCSRAARGPTNWL